MKMPEKYDLLVAIRVKEQGIGAISVCNGVPRADIMAVRFTKTVIDATMRHYRLSSSVTFSTSPD